jgi:hypothetical protein
VYDYVYNCMTGILYEWLSRLCVCDCTYENVDMWCMSEYVYECVRYIFLCVFVYVHECG